MSLDPMLFPHSVLIGRLVRIGIDQLTFLHQIAEYHSLLSLSPSSRRSAMENVIQIRVAVTWLVTVSECDPECDDDPYVCVRDRSMAYLGIGITITKLCC